MFLAAAVSASAAGGGERGSVSPDLDAKVAALVEEALVEGTEAQAFQKLEALGCPAVPAIVKHLDDRRKLPVAYIRLQNHSADAFEAFRQYGPEVLTDALAAILNQVTGQHFGFIYNGGTEEERAKVVKGWREFVAKTPPDRLCSAG
jgi:hypothetical protein